MMDGMRRDIVNTLIDVQNVIKIILDMWGNISIALIAEQRWR
jgi:hypothetical protein